MNRVSRIEQGIKRNKLPSFRVGDTIRVSVKVKEGDKERIQVFEGNVIARKGGGHRETATVRKISFGVGVERVFPLHAPTLEKIEVVQRGRVRRAKLYYLRKLKGKAARISERDTGGARRAARAKTPVVKPEVNPTEPVESSEAETVQVDKG